MFFLGIAAAGLGYGAEPASDAGAAAESDPADAIARGRELTHEKCTECHSLRRVFAAHYAKAEWNEAIDRMVGQGLEISPESRADVIEYLLSQEGDRRTTELLGEFHFFLIHFPIALLLVLPILEGFAAARGPGLTRDSTHVVVVLAAILAVLTAAAGYLLVVERLTIPPLMAWHRNLGIAAAILAVATWIARAAAIRRGTPAAAWLYRGMLGTAALTTAVAGHLGGWLVHGDYLGQLFHLF